MKATQALRCLGQKPDTRLAPPRHGSSFFSVPQPAGRKEWNKRAQWVRRRILLSAGLIPAPTRTPLNTRIRDVRNHDGFSVAKVTFESRPGFLVTGNLYRPLRIQGKRPAVLCPHGHWPKGRMECTDISGLPGRAMMLARLGFVAFLYDMIGYNDSLQLRHNEAFCPTTWLYGISSFGLQLWNSIRAVDFLQSLPEVDGRRIGCTGESGGGTQSYYLAAVDDRVGVIVPVCMMSAHFQGGCGCENGPGLHRHNLSSVDVVGALAPRPVLLPSVTRDWTNQNPYYEVPAIRAIYALYGAAKRVGEIHVDTDHGFCRPMRERMYAWFLKWLAADTQVGASVKEPALSIPPASDLRLFPNNRPPTGFKRGRPLLNQMIQDAAQVFDRPPRSHAGWRRMVRRWRPIYEECLDAHEPEVAGISVCGDISIPGVRYRLICRTLGRPGTEERIPAAWIVASRAPHCSPVVLLVNAENKWAWFGNDNLKRLHPLPAAFLKAGLRVMILDLLGQGETAEAWKNSPQRKSPLFYCAFNRSLLARRLQDILTAVVAMRQEFKTDRLILAGTGIGGVLALLARPLISRLSATAVDLGDCAVNQDRFWLKEMFHPQIRRLGDVCGAVALSAPSPMLLAGADRRLIHWSKTIYKLAGKSAGLAVVSRINTRALPQWVASHVPAKRPSAVLTNRSYTTT